MPVPKKTSRATGASCEMAPASTPPKAITPTAATATPALMVRSAVLVRNRPRRESHRSRAFVPSIDNKAIARTIHPKVPSDVMAPITCFRHGLLAGLRLHFQRIRQTGSRRQLPSGPVAISIRLIRQRHRQSFPSSHILAPALLGPGEGVAVGCLAEGQGIVGGRHRPEIVGFVRSTHPPKRVSSKVGVHVKGCCANTVTKSQ